MRDGQQARNGVEQRALAGAVRTQDSHQSARADLEGDAGQRHVSAAFDGYVLDGYARLGSYLGHHRSPSHPGMGTTRARYYQIPDGMAPSPQGFDYAPDVRPHHLDVCLRAAALGTQGA